MPSPEILMVLLAISVVLCVIFLILMFKSREQAIRLKTELETTKQHAIDGQHLIDQARITLKDAFANVSSQVLKSSNEQFLTLAQTHFESRQKTANYELDSRKQAIETLLKPVSESLHQMQSRIGEIEKDRTKSYAELNEQIKIITQVNDSLRQETSKLSQALHSRSARGRWGELQLKRIVEMSGMLARCDFSEQTQQNDGEASLRPDMVVHLPGNRSIIVDAKAPMDAYLEAIEQDDPHQRKLLLARHAQQVKAHLVHLGNKAYHSQLKQSPEFVVMFLPGESFFQAALEADPGLIEYGVTQKVIPATPTTLIALLKAVAYGWQQEQLAENAEKISKAGADLYDSCVTLTEHFNGVGQHLNKAVAQFNKSLGSYEKRLLPKAQKLKELGVAGKKEMPDNLNSIEMLAKVPETE